METPGFSLSQIVRIVAYMVLAFGIPIGAAFAFRNTIETNPMLSFLVLLTYEAVLFTIRYVTRFTSKVWDKLENDLVEEAYLFVNKFRKNTFSKYKREYLQYVEFRNRDFDVKGLNTQNTYTLNLEQVYVQLVIAPSTIHEAQKGVIPRSASKQSNKAEIWSYIKSTYLHNLVIIGPPGSGKTTLLKHIVLSAGHKNSEITEIPVLLYLRNHADQIVKKTKEKTPYNLIDAIHESLEVNGPTPPADWFAERLENGECIVALDGLDEVADLEARKVVVKWVESQTVKYRRNRFIVTSRPHGYRSNPLSSACLTSEPIGQNLRIK